MSAYQVIVLAAGKGKRMNAGQNKQFLLLANKPLIIHTLEVFERDPWCQVIKLIINPSERDAIEKLIHAFPFTKQIDLVNGGAERQESVFYGLKACRPSGIVLIHDGARPFVEESHLHKLVIEAEQHKAALLAVPVTDTIKSKEKQQVMSLDRTLLWAAQTPQAFDFDLIFRAHLKAQAEEFLGTDDASLVERLEKNIEIVEGSYDNIKLTTPEDLKRAEIILMNRGLIKKEEEQQMFRVGQGFDVHQLVKDRPCIIGGVEIPYEKGLLGHSDADVLLHTVADACLGAIGEGDIGRHFPDTDPAFKDADSVKLLEHVWKIVREKGYMLGNVDCTIIAQAPKMAPYIQKMRENLARILEADVSQINVKATTTEKLGFTGRKEGIACQAVVMLAKENN